MRLRLRYVLARRRPRIPWRNDAFEPGHHSPDIIADRPEEALRIYAHPEGGKRDRGEQPPFAQIEVGHHGGISVALSAEADAPIEPQHIGSAEDDPER